MTSFNLVHDPWLPVLDVAGTYRLVGLADAFTAAERCSVTAGGALDDTAISRWLLAIAYAALGAPTAADYPVRSTGPAIADWVRTHDEHFELLDSPLPVAQDPTLADTDAPILPPSILDPLVGRDRPKVTDWRSLDDEPTMTFAAAARALVSQLAYSVGGRHKGVRDSMPESPLTWLIAFRVSGTLDDYLTWMRIPTTSLGTAHWTWCDRDEVGGGIRGVRADGDLDALTWLSRRYRLHHDTTRITGIQHALGWRRAPESDDIVFFDSGPGRHDLAVSADGTKPAKASAIGGRGWRASSGDPIELTIAWERGGPDSLSHYVRHAPRTLNPPTIVASGHQIESKVLWQGGFCTPIPYPQRDLTARATLITKARSQSRAFGDVTDTDLLTTPDADDEAATLDALTSTLRRRPLRPVPDPSWPRHTDSIWTPHPAATATAPSGEGDDLLDAEDLAFLAEEGRALTAATPTADDTISAVWSRLLADPTLAQAIATTTRTRLPDLAQLATVTTTPTANLLLWAGLAATWLTTTPAPRWKDATTPLPVALRHASAATRSSHGAQIIARLAATARHPAALRAPLLDALTLLAGAGKAPSWRSLYDDLTHWNTTTVKRWESAYWQPALTTATATTTTTSN